MAAMSGEPERREANTMKSVKKSIVVGLAVAFLMVLTTTSAKAECCYFNPFALPFIVAGAAVGTAAAVTTGVLGLPFYAGYPYYYGPSYYAAAPYYYRPVYHAPVPYYYGPRYRHYGYYGPRPSWGRAAWGPRPYHRYGAWGHRYHRSALPPGSGRHSHAGYRRYGR